LTGVLRTVDSRTDLKGRADLRIMIEYAGDVWTGIYPDNPNQRAEVGEERLRRMHRMMSQYIGQDMAHTVELDVG
jgi:hypothetical protein